MPARTLDLHTHSRYSDGTSTPAEVVRRARAREVEVLVLTDHDSVSGYPEASREAEKIGMRVLCGIEINTCEDDMLHILGYRVDFDSPKLASRLEEFRNRRENRLKAIVKKLRDESKIDLDWNDIETVSKESLGRPHVADAMVRKKIVHSRKEAFDKFLMKGRPGYVDPMGPTAKEAIETIREAGGWASLAHPGTMDFDEGLPRLAALGLEGIEVYYPTHTNETIARLLRLAEQHRLIPTGGSDYHGPGTGRDRIGGIHVQPELFDRLMERLR